MVGLLITGRKIVDEITWWCYVCNSCCSLHIVGKFRGIISSTTPLLDTSKHHHFEVYPSLPIVLENWSFGLIIKFPIQAYLALSKLYLLLLLFPALRKTTRWNKIFPWTAQQCGQNNKKSYRHRLLKKLPNDMEGVGALWCFSKVSSNWAPLEVLTSISKKKGTTPLPVSGSDLLIRLKVLSVPKTAQMMG